MNNNNICKVVKKIKYPICNGERKLTTIKDNITSIKICNGCKGEGEVFKK